MRTGIKMAVAGGAVGVVSLAGVSLASANGTGGSGPAGEIRDRVAGILGIDSAELQDAFEQARGEVRSEKMDERLAEAVADGTITQEQADEIRSWMDARPDVLDEIGHGRGHGRGHGHGDRDGSRDGSSVEERLAGLVEDGTITQEDADAVLAWRDARPESMDNLRPDRTGEHGRHRGPGRGFQLRVGPGPDGEFGRFGGHIFRLPPHAESPADVAPDVAPESVTL